MQVTAQGTGNEWPLEYDINLEQGIKLKLIVAHWLASPIQGLISYLAVIERS